MDKVSILSPVYVLGCTFLEMILNMSVLAVTM